MPSITTTPPMALLEREDSNMGAQRWGRLRNIHRVFPIMNHDSRGVKHSYATTKPTLWDNHDMSVATHSQHAVWGYLSIRPSQRKLHLRRGVGNVLTMDISRNLGIEGGKGQKQNKSTYSSCQSACTIAIQISTTRCRFGCVAKSKKEGKWKRK